MERRHLPSVATRKTFAKSFCVPPSTWYRGWMRGQSAFWKNFLANTWEREPTHLGRALEPLLTSEEAFALTVRVRDSFEKPAKGAARLPVASDRNFLRYSERLRHGPDFFFQLSRLQTVEPLLWPRLARFVENFYPVKGRPSVQAATGLFIGRYASTPFGAHVDHGGTFTFGIEGEKTFHFWEPEVFHEHMGGERFGFEKFVRYAKTLTVGPGEVLYWPSRSYHVAVPGRKFSVTLGYSFFDALDPAALLKNTVKDLLPAELEHLQGLRNATVPPSLRDAARAFRRAVSDGAVERALAKTMVEHATALGFLLPPPLREARRLRLRDRLTKAPGAPIACVPYTKSTVLVSASGYSMEVPKSDGLALMIGALNSKETFSVEALLARLASRAVAKQDNVAVTAATAIGRPLLERLVQWRGVDLVLRVP